MNMVVKNSLTPTELNIWIAEYIMGWQWYELDTQKWGVDHAFANMRVLRPDASNGVFTLPAGKHLPILEGMTLYYVPDYQGNLVESWCVFERCQQHHVYLDIGAGMPQGYFGHAKIHATGDEQGFSSATVPDLICWMAYWARNKMGDALWADSFNPKFTPSI